MGGGAWGGGGAAVPGAMGGGAMGGGMAGGGLPTFTRQETSRARLKILWENYVKVHEERLDRETALREVKGRDPRPVLLLRDCDTCAGKDDALLESSMEDEKILLASRWFHCVRVDKGVLKDNHPLNSLFPDNNAPHMILYSSDGSVSEGLGGKPSAKKLWGVMNKVLAKDYTRSAEQAMVKWIAILSRFDALDSRKGELKEQRERTENQKKAAALDKELRTVEEQMRKAREDEKKIADLGLRGATNGAGALDLDAAAAEAVRGTGGRKSLLDKVKKTEGQDSK